MAIISKLRRSGWVLGLVLVSLLLFVISDFLTNYNKYTSGGDRGEVGEIAGKKIKLDEFDAQLKDMTRRYEENGQAIDENAKTQLNTMVWNQMLQDLVINKEIDKAGIAISTDEATQLLYSNDAHEMIKRYFSTETGFDPNNVIRFREQAKKNPTLMAQFEAIIEQIFLETKTKKYNSLVSKSLYATSLDAEDDYANTTTQAKGKIVTLNYLSIPDKDIKVTDSDLQDYINKHKEDFKQEESRDIEFAVWSVIPTSEDSATTREELVKSISDFQKAENDSLYVELNNGKFDPTFKPQGGFDNAISNAIVNAPKDTVLGPVYYAGGYSLLKVINTKEDSISYVHAVKCEVPVGGITKEDTLKAMANAKALLAEIRSSNDAYALMNAKANEGLVKQPVDMGWFQEGTQPREINNAIKGLGNGDATFVRSIFGLSIVKLVAPKSKKMYQLAEVRADIRPSQQTRDAVYSKAVNFRNSITDEKVDFEKLTSKAGIAKSIAKDVKESDRMISGVPEAGEIVRWLFSEDRSEGESSDVFSMNDRDVVVRIAKIKHEGTKSVDDAREEVERIVRNEKKAEKLKADFEKALKNAKTAEDVAMGVKSVAQPIDGLTFNSSNVPFAGGDAKIVGYIFGSKPGQLSKPFASRDGVHVVFIESFTKAELPTTLNSRKTVLYMEKKSRIYELIFNALKKAADVKDFRFRYY